MNTTEITIGTEYVEDQQHWGITWQESVVTAAHDLEEEYASASNLLDPDEMREIVRRYVKRTWTDTHVRTVTTDQIGALARAINEYVAGREDTLRAGLHARAERDFAEYGYADTRCPCGCDRS